MQLFHIDADKVHIKWNNLEIFPVHELIYQLRKVLRIQKWDKIYIQYYNDKWTTRNELSIENWTDNKITGKIISTQTFSFYDKKISLLIAMPNKREKAELIAQKLTEIWVDNIYFRPSEHSIIRQWNTKKADRINKISREAVEQSWWIKVPEIKFLESENDIKNFISWKEIILANIGWIHFSILKINSNKYLCWIIWPEWWFSEKDLKLFKNAKIIDLWTNVLRMETASIILAWLLKNI